MSDSNRKYRVLFVDDERRILTALRSIFRREYEVFIANSGAEALQILEKQTVDVVVSDQRMPNMLGNELLAQVQQLYPQTMRVLLTGFMDKEAIIDTINQGQIYRFINKPWKNDDIREIIAEAALASEFEVESAKASEAASAEEAPQTTALTDGAAAPTEETAGTQPASQNTSVLLMDDDAQTQAALKELCKQQGAALYFAKDIQQVVARLQANPDIGALVVTMPTDATETLHTVSLLKQYRPELVTTVLAMQDDAETIVQLINAGQVFRYLSHPVDHDVLSLTIEDSLHQHQILKKRAEMRQRVKVDNRKLSFSQRIRQLFLPLSRQTAG